jgi:hypothetical protein
MTAFEIRIRAAKHKPDMLYVNRCMRLIEDQLSVEARVARQYIGRQRPSALLRNAARGAFNKGCGASGLSSIANRSVRAQLRRPHQAPRGAQPCGLQRGELARTPVKVLAGQLLSYTFDVIGSSDPNTGGAATSAQWFNTDVLSLPAPFTSGNSGRNTVLAPGNADVDAAVHKDIALRGGTRLELRWEVFNLFNRTNFDVPSRVFGTPNFGRIFSAQPARQMQFGIKFIF